MMKQKVKPKAIKLKRDKTSRCHTQQLLQCPDIPRKRKNLCRGSERWNRCFKSKKASPTHLGHAHSFFFSLGKQRVVRRQTGKEKKVNENWSSVSLTMRLLIVNLQKCPFLRGQQCVQLDEQNLARTPGTCPTTHSGPITSVPVASSVVVLVLGMVRAGARANMHGLKSWLGYPLTVSSWWHY